MKISAPYLLYLGNATDPLTVKTSRGVAVWRPETCVGEYRAEGCTLSLGLPHLDFKDAVARGAKTLILGVANAGGLMGPTAVAHVIEALRAGLDVASGLHDRLNGNADIVAAAKQAGRALFDVREPPRGLPVGNGRRRAGRRLLTVGTDCSVGKMYTTLALERELRKRSIKADFRATGQTGILIAQSGIAIDAVVADFISGATEVISPARDDGGWDLIEGQGSLYHPSYAGVSLGLLHGSQPDAIVLCHEVGREHIRGIAGRPLPDLRACIKANLTAARLTNPDVIAVGVALNTSRVGADEAKRAFETAERELGLPCEDPMVTGVSRIADQLLKCFAPSAAA